MDNIGYAESQLSEILRQQTLLMLRSPSLVGWLVEWGEVGGVRSRGVVLTETVHRSKPSVDGSYPSFLLVLYEMHGRTIISIDTADCKIMKVYPYLREYVILASHWISANEADRQSSHNRSDYCEHGRGEAMVKIIEAELEQRGVSERLDELAAKLPPSKGGADWSFHLVVSSHSSDQGYSALKFGTLKHVLPRGGLQSREGFLRGGDNIAAKTAHRSPQNSQVPHSSSEEMILASMNGSPVSIGTTSSQPFKSQSQSQLHIQKERREIIDLLVTDANEVQPPQALNEVFSDDDFSQSTYSSAEGSVGSRLRRIARRERAKMASQLIAYKEPPIRRSTADEIMAVFEETAPVHLRPLVNKNNRSSPEVCGSKQQDRFTINIPSAIDDASCSPKANIHHERKHIDLPRRPDFGPALKISSVCANIPDLKPAVVTDEGVQRSPLTLRSITNRPLLLSTAGKPNSMWKIAPVNEDIDVEASSAPKKGMSLLAPIEDSTPIKRNLFKDKANLIVRTIKPLARLAPLKNAPSSEKTIKLC
jgi:hypothetical protein